MNNPTSTARDGEHRHWSDDALTLRAFLERAVQSAPDHPFLVHGDEVITYSDFSERVQRAASAWTSLGVRTGDRVAFMLENRPEFVIAWFGLAYAGGVLVAFNTRWQSEEIGHLLELVEPRCALVSPQFLDSFIAANPSSYGVQRMLTLGSRPDIADFFTLCNAAESSHPVELQPDDLLTLISTSGTTGRPKAVMQTHRNFVLTGEGYASWVGLGHDERIYLCLPLFHINSQAYTVMGAIAARATIVLVERFSASRFWGDMVRHRVNVFNFIGSMLAVLLLRDPSPEEREHHVRLAYGGPIPQEPSRAEIEKRFHLSLISGIGMSETTYGLIEPLSAPRREGSLGTARQHPSGRFVNEARAVDDEGHEVPHGEVGELVYRSPVQMKGYYRDPEATARTVRDGWLYTGDLVRQDGDGYFYFVDRKKDLIRVKGENVSSSEVETVLASHADVVDAAAISVPSPLTDDEVAVFVVPRSGANLRGETIRQWCAERLASFKVPTHVWIVDALPKTETQRTEKARLREQARELIAAGRGGTDA
jgi:crotonobetaine/carnitine-CoA ligase